MIMETVLMNESKTNMAEQKVRQYIPSIELQ